MTASLSDFRVSFFAKELQRSVSKFPIHHVMKCLSTTATEQKKQPQTFGLSRKNLHVGSPVRIFAGKCLASKSWHCNRVEDFVIFLARQGFFGDVTTFLKTWIPSKWISYADYCSYHHHANDVYGLCTYSFERIRTKTFADKCTNCCGCFRPVWRVGMKKPQNLIPCLSFPTI